MTETVTEKKSKFPIAITAIIAIAILLRVAAAIWHPMADRTVYPDAGDYHDLANAIVTGHDYKCGGQVAARMPGYPVLIAFVYAIAGSKPVAMLIVQALMGGTICWMIWRMLRSTSQKAALIAAALFAIDPLSIGLSASLLSEAPFSLALIGMVWIGLRLLKNPTVDSKGYWVWGLLGMVSVVAIYLRPSAFYLPAVPMALILSRRQSWHAIIGAVGVFAWVLAWLGIWTSFVNRHIGRIDGLTTLEGISLYEAVYTDATGGPMQGAILKRDSDLLKIGEARRDTYYRNAARTEIREHPGRVIGLAPIKFARFWSPGLNDQTVASTTVSVGLWTWHVPLFLLAIAGLIFGPLRGRPLMMLLLPILYFTVLHMIFIGSVRYRVPLQPLICMLAALGVCCVWSRQKAAGRRQ